MSAPEATLLLGTHCPHCPSVLKSLSELVKTGEISQLKVVNIEAAPEVAQQYRVRSVPWIKIGDNVLTGLQPMDALRQRVQWANDQEKLLGEYDHQLSNGEVQKVIDSIKEDHKRFDAIMALLSDPATILSTRIGIGVVMEEFEDSDLLRDHLVTLGKLLNADDARIRADAAHYLSLTHSPKAIEYLEKVTDETDPEAREVIEDSLENLGLKLN